MHRLYLASIIWLAAVLSVRADSAELPVTPTNLDDNDYTFRVLTYVTQDGMAFHVTIKSKHYDIYPDSGADVHMVTHKKLADGDLEGSVGPVTPKIPIALKKENRLWTADFTVSRELLKNPNACFIFSELGHTTENGKIVAMPSVNFYELRLRDFAKP